MCLFFHCVASPLSGVGCRLQSSKGSRRVKLWINRKWIGRKADKRYTESTSVQQVSGSGGLDAVVMVKDVPERQKAPQQQQLAKQ